MPKGELNIVVEYVETGDGRLHDRVMRRLNDAVSAVLGTFKDMGAIVTWRTQQNMPNVLTYTESLEVKLKVQEDFMVDAVHYTRLFYTGTSATVVHGEEHRDDMVTKYPKEWMDKLYEDVGTFDEEDLET